MRRLDLLVLALGLSVLGTGLVKWGAACRESEAARPALELPDFESRYRGWPNERLLAALEAAELERMSTIETVVRALTEAGEGRVTAAAPGELSEHPPLESWNPAEPGARLCFEEVSEGLVIRREVAITYGDHPDLAYLTLECSWLRRRLGLEGETIPLETDPGR